MYCFVRFCTLHLLSELSNIAIMAKRATISKPALLAIRGLTKEGKKRIADKVGRNLETIYKWIRDNSEEMTKSIVVQAIAEETGLTRDQIIDDPVFVGV